MQPAALRHIERADPSLPVMLVLPTTARESWAEVAGPDRRAYPVRLSPSSRAGDGDNSAHPQAIRSFRKSRVARTGPAGLLPPAADYEILWDVQHKVAAPATTTAAPSASVVETAHVETSAESRHDDA
jgi:hypothetical protein